jgi:hypothetical protein
MGIRQKEHKLIFMEAASIILGSLLVYTQWSVFEKRTYHPLFYASYLQDIILTVNVMI